MGNIVVANDGGQVNGAWTVIPQGWLVQENSICHQGHCWGQRAGMLRTAVGGVGAS